MFDVRDHTGPRGNDLSVLHTAAWSPSTSSGISACISSPHLGQMGRGRCVYPLKLVTQGLLLAITLLISSLGSHPLSYFHIHKTKNLYALFISGEKVFGTNMEIMTSVTRSMLPTTTDLGSFCFWFAFILVFASLRVCCLALTGHKPEASRLSLPSTPSTMMARRLSSFTGGTSVGRGRKPQVLQPSPLLYDQKQSTALLAL